MGRVLQRHALGTQLLADPPCHARQQLPWEHECLSHYLGPSHHRGALSLLVAKWGHAVSPQYHVASGLQELDGERPQAQQEHPEGPCWSQALQELATVEKYEYCCDSKSQDIPVNCTANRLSCHPRPAATRAYSRDRRYGSPTTP